jgi:protoporphyrinogen oxidase
VPDPGRVVIIGAGPCGLACARELDALGVTSWTILEQADQVGGLAGSVVDDAGFTWDHGGHVVFSHYGEFDRLLADTMGDEVEHHDRASYVRFAGDWVPYPFQNNLHRLPPEVTLECVLGLVEASGHPAGPDFGQWLRARFGEGITRHFMEPYNRKVWAGDPGRMSSSWMAERVSEIDVGRALRSVILREDDVAWGPNSRFAFPAEGGTGEIYRRAAAPLADRIRLEASVVTVDPGERSVTLADGTTEHYTTLVSTMPVDLLARAAGAPRDVLDAAAALEHTSVTVVGIGYAAPVASTLSWAYFPDPDVPFYRATNFGSYARRNVPDGDTDRFSSWMTEVAHRPGEDPGPEVAERVDRSLRDAGLVPAGAEVVSVHRNDLAYAYPVPTLGRDVALQVLHGWLDDRRIYSRGRFGGWRYELGNMDHAVKMGVDLARHLACGTAEEAWA